MAHSRGVILRNRATGPHRYRDETKADGGLRYLRRRARRLGDRVWRREWGV